MPRCSGQVEMDAAMLPRCKISMILSDCQCASMPRCHAPMPHACPACSFGLVVSLETWCQLPRLQPRCPRFKPFCLGTHALLASGASGASAVSTIRRICGGDG
jgi:hypothetical protein